MYPKKSEKGAPGGEEMGRDFGLPRENPRGEFWGVQGGGQQEEGKDLRRLVDPKGSADSQGGQLRNNLINQKMPSGGTGVVPLHGPLIWQLLEALPSTATLRVFADDIGLSITKRCHSLPFIASTSNKFSMYSFLHFSNTTLFSGPNTSGLD